MDVGEVFSVALLGIYPPPIGGVSVHIKRLKSKSGDKGIKFTVYDIGATEDKGELDVIQVPNPKKWLIWYILFADESVVHYHGHSWKFRAILLLLKLRSKKVIFTFHSFRGEIKTFGLLEKFLVKLVCHFGNFFIATGPHIKDKLLRIGVNPSRVGIIPPFIPPLYSSSTPSVSESVAVVTVTRMPWSL